MAQGEKGAVSVTEAGTGAQEGKDKTCEEELKRGEDR
jgi:hypothetical protein